MPVRPRGCDSREPELPENIDGFLEVSFGVVRVPFLEFRMGHFKVVRVAGSGTSLGRNEVVRGIVCL